MAPLKPLRRSGSSTGTISGIPGRVLHELPRVRIAESGEMMAVMVVARARPYARGIRRAVLAPAQRGAPGILESSWTHAERS